VSYNGSGTFNINTAGQPVVTGTVISSTAFNALTADLASGLSTAITKDGQTIVTANIPFNTFKLTGIGVATATGDALTYNQAATVTTLVASTSITDSGLTATRLTFAGVGGLLSDSANLTWDGSYLSAASIKDTALTSGRVTYAGTAGLLQDSANLTFNGTTLTANTIGAFTLGGTVAGGGNNINNVIIGATTPLAGAFTTLTANGTAATNTTALTAQGTTTGFNRGRIFNTGGDLRFGIDSSVGAEALTGSAAYSSFIGSFTNTPFYLVSNSAIVGTVSSTGLAVTGNIDLTAATTFPTTGMFLRAADNQLKICAGSAGIAFAAASGASTLATLDSSGNLGLGVTPSAWSGQTALQIASSGAIASSNSSLDIYANAYYNAGNKYIQSSYASRYTQTSGQHQWYTAPSGTAGNAITFTQSLAVGKGTTLALEGATSATGTGIAFPATQSASSDANTLDDYEEGTWTPSLTSFTVVGSPTYTGFYTKVGRQVTVVMQLTATTISSTGSSFVNNLPFSAAVPSVGSAAFMTDNGGTGSASNGYIVGVSFYPGASSATQYKYLTATYFTS